MKLYAAHIELMELSTGPEADPDDPLRGITVNTGLGDEPAVQAIIMGLRDEMLQVRSAYEQAVQEAAKGQPMQGVGGSVPGGGGDWPGISSVVEVSSEKGYRRRKS